MEIGQESMHEREFNAAIELFSRATRLIPNNPDPDFHIGESLFRMDRYEEAIQAFKTALQKNPSNYSALRRSWAAKLEHGRHSRESKAIVQNEIDELIAHNPADPEELLVACYGYRYLNQRAKCRPILRQLMEAPDEPEFKPEVASLLLDELLGESDPKQRLVLSERYIQRYSDGPGIGVALHVFLKTKKKLTKDAADFATVLSEFANRQPGTRAYNRTVARWLVQQDLHLNRAIELFEADPSLEELTLNLAPPAKQPLTSHGFELADDLYYLAVAHHRLSDSKEAERLLRLSSRLNDADPRIYDYLGKMAEENGKEGQAMDYYVQALERDSGHKDSESRLRDLLVTAHDYDGEPHLFFAQQNNVPTFTDVTESAGLANVKASAVAWGDYDNDGLVDVLLDGMLFRNDGKGHFEDVTERVGLSITTNANGGAWADYDNDGLLDVLITSHGPNRLFHNTGDTFVDVSDSAFPKLRNDPTEAAAWGDLDNDGLIDLYVANYQRPGVERALCTHDQLYRNLGNGRFEDISEQAGIITEEAMCGRDVTWSDLNNDGWQDILVSNYRLDPNFLWINNKDNTLQDKARAYGARGENSGGYYGHTIGSVTGDLDNDGHLDIFVSNLAHPRFIEFSDTSMVLLKAGDKLRFNDEYNTSNVRFEETSSKPSLADVDSDGDLDLYVTSTYPGRRSHLYVNDRSARFTDVTWLAGTGVENGWGNAFADYDGDGNHDLFVASNDGVRLFRNDGEENQ